MSPGNRSGKEAVTLAPPPIGAKLFYILLRGDQTWYLGLKEPASDPSAKERIIGCIHVLFVLGTKIALRSTAELPISLRLLGLRHRFCSQGPISNQRPVLDSPSKTTRGM